MRPESPDLHYEHACQLQEPLPDISIGQLSSRSVHFELPRPLEPSRYPGHIPYPSEPLVDWNDSVEPPKIDAFVSKSGFLPAPEISKESFAIRIPKEPKTDKIEKLTETEGDKLPKKIEAPKTPRK